MLFVKFDKQVQ